MAFDGRATTTSTVHRLGRGGGVTTDALAVEEPLAIRIAVADEVRRLATTMRTPGADDELAVGWLVAEGLVRSRTDVFDVSRCARWEHAGASHEATDHTAAEHANIVTVTLRGDAMPAVSHLDRHGVVSSACGVCGRASIDALTASGVPPVTWHGPPVDAQVLHAMPDAMRRAQDAFDATGGLHAVARFDATGRLLALREDVGRHNAFDKVVGAALLDDDLPLAGEVVVLSGRASYELLVKAAVAGVGVVAAVGAPSSLAVEVADEFGITLVGFLRADRANVHTHPDRLRPEVTT